MIKLTRRGCVFSISLDNRIMLLEIKSLSSLHGEELDLAEVINAALKGYLPSLLASMHRISRDEKLAGIGRMIDELESELYEESSD